MSVDTDLLVMARARMSPASIAALMGGGKWTPARVERRLAALAAVIAMQEPSASAAEVFDLAAPAPTPSALQQARSAWQGRVVPPRKLRYCRWFLAAGWSLAQVAWLFDEEAEDLAAATE